MILTGIQKLDPKRDFARSARPVQRRESARVGAREQLVPGLVVEALGLSDPPAVEERDAPDEDPPAGGARRLPASGQGQEV